MAMPEYMRVRQHLYNLVAKADGSELQIPTENELCRLFNVSRITVRGAIRGLVKDKFLIPRRGIGTFMNPAAIGQGVKRIPSVGLLTGDGRSAMGSFDPVLAKCALDSGLCFETLFVPESGDPERLVEMASSGVDAVIWSAPLGEECSRMIEALAASRMPFLAVDTERDYPPCNCDSVLADRAKRGVKLANQLHAKGHSSMLFVHNLTGNALQKALEVGSTHWSFCAQMGRLCGSKERSSDAISIVEFEQRLADGDTSLRRYSVLYSLADYAPYIMKALRRSGLSVPGDFSLLTYGEPDSRFFNGRKPAHIAYEKALREAMLDWMELRLLDGIHDGPFSKRVEMDIVEGDTLINNRMEGI